MPKTFSLARSAFQATREVGGGIEQRPLMLCGQPEQISPLRDALMQGAEEGTPAVRSHALRRLQPADRDDLKKAGAVVYGGAVATSLDDGTRGDLEVVGRVYRPKLALLESLELPSPAVTAASRVRGISPDDVLAYERGSYPHARAMRALAGRVDGSAPWLAAQLPALRPYVVDDVIEAAARRNARLALLIFIPGADMPVLTAVQMKMVLQLAACHGQHVGKDRAVELLSVLGVGFGFRQIARSMLDFVPVAGWVIQAGVAYVGTKAMGKAAVEYFERGAVADVDHLRELAEDARGDLPGVIARLREDGFGVVRDLRRR
jgi:uncharacterized protein (DUF697 family)